MATEQTGNDKGKGPHEIPFDIDTTPHKLPSEQNPVKGSYLRGLEPKVPEDYDLWHRGRGQEDDRIIGPDDEIEIVPGDHFFTAKRVVTPGQ